MASGNDPSFLPCRASFGKPLHTLPGSTLCLVVLLSGNRCTLASASTLAARSPPQYVAELRARCSRPLWKDLEMPATPAKPALRDRVLVCNCQKTMAIDTAALAKALALNETPVVHTELCRAEVSAFETALLAGQPLHIACTQEAPLFREVADDKGSADAAAFHQHPRARRLVPGDKPTPRRKWRRCLPMPCTRRRRPR